MGWKGEDPQRQVQYSHETLLSSEAVLGVAGSPRKAKQKLIILGVLGNKFCFVFFFLQKHSNFFSSLFYIGV